jgi:hypothetical protein
MLNCSCMVVTSFVEQRCNHEHVQSMCISILCPMLADVVVYCFIAVYV